MSCRDDGIDSLDRGIATIDGEDNINVSCLENDLDISAVFDVSDVNNSRFGCRNIRDSVGNDEDENKTFRDFCVETKDASSFDDDGEMFCVFDNAAAVDVDVDDKNP